MNLRAKWMVLGVALCCMAGAADAARIGGGRAFGAQRPSISAPRSTPQAATPSAPSSSASSTKPLNGPAADPVMPRTAPAAAGAAAAGSASAAARAPGGVSRWLGPVAGIGAALGLAALLSHAGFGPGMSDILTLAMLAAGALLLVKFFLARRAQAGALETPNAMPRAPAETPFDARFGGASPSPPPAQAEASRFPPGFDAERFARQATQQFRAVQRAYDHGDTALLADVMTPELYTETVKELRERGLHIPTEFEAVDAEVVDVTTEADMYWVSVRFHGLSREDGARTAQPFDEVWNLSKPLDGSTGWLVAGVQQPIAA